MKPGESSLQHSDHRHADSRRERPYGQGFSDSHRKRKTKFDDRVEGAEHNEAAWSRRVGPFLQFLYPAPETKV